MQVGMESLEQIYCENCHLATPTWRKKCIHCTKPLQWNTKSGVIARNANSSSTDGRGFGSRVSAHRS